MKKRFNSRSQQVLQQGNRNTGAAIAGLRDATNIETAARAMVAIQRRAKLDDEKERQRAANERLNKLLPR
jgi:hypothetical protein